MRKEGIQKMPDIAWVAMIVVAYLLLSWFVLPRLGVPT
jgi:hypothetical protein